MLLVAVLAVAVVGCDRGDDAPPEATSTNPTVATSVTGVTGVTGATGVTSSGPSGVALPSPVNGLLPGESYFGVYLAVAPLDAPELDQAVNRLTELGIASFPVSLACDQGAAEQLRVDAELAGVAAYFEHHRDAIAFARRMDPAPIGIALIRPFCND